MKIKILLILSILFPSVAFSESSGSYGYNSTSGTLTSGSSSADLSLSGFETSLKIDVLKNTFLALSYVTVDGVITIGGTSGAVESNSFSFGGGYYFSNDLDTFKGTGSATGLGIAFSSASVSVLGVKSKENSETIIANSTFALSPGVSTTFSISSPYDDLGSSLAGGIGVNYFVTDNDAVSLGYSSSSSNVDGVKASASGFNLSYTNIF